MRLLLYALGPHRLFGRATTGQLPWRCREDMDHFWEAVETFRQATAARLWVGPKTWEVLPASGRRRLSALYDINFKQPIFPAWLCIGGAKTLTEAAPLSTHAVVSIIHNCPVPSDPVYLPTLPMPSHSVRYLHFYHQT
jgi:hypothetical protein